MRDRAGEGDQRLAVLGCAVVSRIRIIARFGASTRAASGRRRPRASGPRRTRRCGGSPRPRPARRPGRAAAGSRAPPGGDRRGGRPGRLSSSWSWTRSSGSSSREPKAVRSAWLACRIAPPSSMIATPSSRWAITRSSSSARTARTASDSWSLVTVLSTWRRLRLMVIPSTISTTTKTWAIAGLAHRVVDSGDRADVEDGEPDARGACEQAGSSRDHRVEADGDPHDGERQHERGGGLGVQHEPEREDRGRGRGHPERLPDVGRSRAGEGRPALVVVLGQPAAEQQPAHAERGHRCERPGGPAERELERLRGDQQLTEGGTQKRVGQHAHGHRQEDEAEVGHRAHRLAPASSPQMRGPAPQQVEHGQGLQREQHGERGLHRRAVGEQEHDHGDQGDQSDVDDELAAVTGTGQPHQRDGRTRVRSGRRCRAGRRGCG